MATAGDTAFGVTRYCEHAIWDDLPKIAFCTQEYNLFTQNKVEFGEYRTYEEAPLPCLLLEFEELELFFSNPNLCIGSFDGCWCELLRHILVSPPPRVFLQLPPKCGGDFSRTCK